MTNTQTIQATDFQCNVERDGETCWIFPFSTSAELAAHEATGKHSFPSDMDHRTTAAFESIRTFATGNGGTAAPRAAYTPDARELEAIEFAKAYTGTFEFMVSMKAKAAKVTFRPSPKMVDAILRCKARQTPVEAPVAVVAPVAHRYTGMTWAEVMEANEYFDGEPEVTERHRAAWEAANAAPVAPAVSLPSNRFGGSCTKCGGYVDAEAGHRQNVNGKWTVLHAEGACVTGTPTAPAAAAEVDVTPGTYVFQGTYDLDGVPFPVRNEVA